MGDAALAPAPKEHLLITFMRDLAPDQLEEIKAKFPQLEVLSVTLKRGEDIPSGEFSLSYLTLSCPKHIYL